MEPAQTIDINALKAQVDAEIAARLLIEADSARYIQRRGFCIGDLKLLVPLDATSEVLEMPPLFRLPGAPAGIMGLANRHGRVVPVMDLSVLFEMPLDRAASSWLLVCGRGDEAVGLVIDSLPERKSFVQDDEIGACGDQASDRRLRQGGVSGWAGISGSTLIPRNFSPRYFMSSRHRFDTIVFCNIYAQQRTRFGCRDGLLQKL